MRIAIVKMSCPACLELKKVLPAINMRLPLEKKIRIIDNTSLEVFGIKNDFIQDKLDDENFQAYPIVYIDGAMIIGAVESYLLKIHIEQIVSEDLI